MKFHIKKNDMVQVIAGKNKGKKGKVLKINLEKQQVIIEGVNFVKRHMRKSQKNPNGGIMEIEAPFNLSNVLVVCPRCQKGVRTGNRIFADGSKSRFCVRCEEAIGEK